MERDEKTSELPKEAEEKQEISLVEDAKKSVEELKALLKEKKEILDREEKLLSLRQLGGQSFAGKKEEKKEETPQEYAKRILRGGKI